MSLRHPTLTLLAITAFILAPSPARGEGGEPVAFLVDLDEALGLAQDANRPLMVHLSAEWCEPCKLMKVELYPRPEIRPLLARFIRVEVDVDSPRGKRLWMEHAVQGLPAVLFLQPDGQERKDLRLTTVPEPAELKTALEAALAPSTSVEGAEPTEEPKQPGWIQALWFIGCALLMASIYLTLKKQYAREEARKK